MNQRVCVETLDIELPTTARSTSHFCLGHSALGAMLSFFNSPPSPQEREREWECKSYNVSQLLQKARDFPISYALIHMLRHILPFASSIKATTPSFWNSPFNSSIQQLTEKCRLSKSPTTLLSSGTGLSSTTTASSRLGLLNFAKIKKSSGPQHQGTLRGRSGRLVLHSQGNRGTSLDLSGIKF